MKTTTQFFKLKKPLLCIGGFLSSLPSWLQLFSPHQVEKKESNKENQTWKSSKTVKHLMTMVNALVARVAAVANSKAVVKAFPRFVVGLVTLVVVAPYADTFYTMLDPNDRVSPEVWYYESYNWLFLCLGPYLKSVLNVIGIYLVLVHKSHIKTYVLAFPMMYDIGKILWLLQVSNHDEYNAVTPEMYTWYGLFAGLFLIGVLNLLSFWLFHRVHAIKARLMGLRNIADKVDSQTIVKSFVETMDADVKVRQFNS
jgi:hypothetical protein